jgi:hypothetical protein
VKIPSLFRGEGSGAVTGLRMGGNFNDLFSKVISALPLQCGTRN